MQNTVNTADINYCTSIVCKKREKLLTCQWSSRNWNVIICWQISFTDNSLSMKQTHFAAIMQIDQILDKKAQCHLHITHQMIMISLSLSLHYNGHFPGGPGLASTGMSSFWILSELRMMEVVVTTGAIRGAKLESKMSPPTNQQPVVLQAGCLSCRPTNSVKALMGK